MGKIYNLCFVARLCPVGRAGCQRVRILLLSLRGIYFYYLWCTVSTIDASVLLKIFGELRSVKSGICPDTRCLRYYTEIHEARGVLKEINSTERPSRRCMFEGVTCWLWAVGVAGGDI